MTLKEVCDTYYTTVYHRCLYDLYFNEELAEEAAQQVFVVLCEKWPALQQHPNLEGWLLRTASYKVQKAKAGYTQRLELVSTDAEDFIEPVRIQDFHDQIVSEHLEENMGRYAGKVYGQLSEKERQLLGYMQKKMKYAEIAQRMNMTEGAVSMAAVRLSRKIRRIVREIVDNVL
ncbi:MAG: sigma-70 family RNA polymerase sigma factor, partial [Clostridia bacterium]|nr:sigma-70 family RNA polymerase sigma factor [Clostridia bacterium]